MALIHRVSAADSKKLEVDRDTQTHKKGKEKWVTLTFQMESDRWLISHSASP